MVVSNFSDSRAQEHYFVDRSGLEFYPDNSLQNMTCLVKNNISGELCSVWTVVPAVHSIEGNRYR